MLLDSPARSLNRIECAFVAGVKEKGVDLVSSVPSGTVGRAQGLANQTSNFAKYCVANSVPVAIID
jgi:hypothetical protein